MADTTTVIEIAVDLVANRIKARADSAPVSGLSSPTHHLETNDGGRRNGAMLRFLPPTAKAERNAVIGKVISLFELKAALHSQSWAGSRIVGRQT